MIGFIYAGFRANSQSDCIPRPEDCFAEPVPLMAKVEKSKMRQQVFLYLQYIKITYNLIICHFGPASG